MVGSVMVALPSMTAFTRSFDTHRKSVGAEMLRTVMSVCLVGMKCYASVVGIVRYAAVVVARVWMLGSSDVEKRVTKRVDARERKCMRVANACQVLMKLPTAVAPKKDTTDELLLLMMPREQERMDHEEEECCDVV